MKGLTLTLPYPYLIAAAAVSTGLGKSWETRDWAPATWRGTLAIHVAKNLAPVGGRAGLYDLCARPPFRAALAALGLTPLDVRDAAPRGVIVAVAEFGGAGRAIWKGGPAVRWDAAGEDVSRVEEPELSFGDYSYGRRIWRLETIRVLRAPVPCRGAVGLWEVSAEVAALVEAQLAAA